MTRGPNTESEDQPLPRTTSPDGRAGRRRALRMASPVTFGIGALTLLVAGLEGRPAVALTAGLTSVALATAALRWSAAPPRGIAVGTGLALTAVVASVLLARTAAPHLTLLDPRGLLLVLFTLGHLHLHRQL